MEAMRLMDEIQPRRSGNSVVSWPGHVFCVFHTFLRTSASPLLLLCDTRFLRFLCENTPALMKNTVIIRF